MQTVPCNCTAHTAQLYEYTELSHAKLTNKLTLNTNKIHNTYITQQLSEILFLLILQMGKRFNEKCDLCQ